MGACMPRASRQERTTHMFPTAPDLDAIVRHAATLASREQLSYVTQSCRADAGLYRAAVERLRALGTGELLVDSLAEPPSDPEDWSAVEDRAGEILGVYRLVRRLGIGGMGAVYLAERNDQQFSQSVAIKLVRRGLVSKDVRSRLKSERQILATLDHPNIARLLDGGTTLDGIPYLVMEYVDGQPIDAYCDSRKLDVTARLKLFRKVCSAVHAAHQNLIVHRDLKPSNILVTEDGEPKLLDFGIAKLLDVRPSHHTMALTRADLRVLTPDHASPEQVQGGPITTERHLRPRRAPVRASERLPSIQCAWPEDSGSGARHLQRSAGGAGLRPLPGEQRRPGIRGAPRHHRRAAQAHALR